MYELRTIVTPTAEAILDIVRGQSFVRRVLDGIGDAVPISDREAAEEIEVLAGDLLVKATQLRNAAIVGRPKVRIL